MAMSLLFAYSNCSLSKESSLQIQTGNNLATQLAAQTVFEKIHSQSETIYDGSGHWGENQFGYRMMLRDSYWRADVYLRLRDQNPIYLQRLQETLQYLLTVQTEGGSGVFGIPADPMNPEFGSYIPTIQQQCSTCIVNGWVISFPPSTSAESLYYDHGYALHTLALAYLKLSDATLLPAIRKAADWILLQPSSANTNYMSALAKGLSTAFLATGDTRYRNRAIQIHTNNIFPHQLANGEWDDPHNQQLEYHGFIVSGLIALKKIVPANDPIQNNLDSSLARALAVMESRDQSENSSYDQTWMGTNLLAWIELRDLRTLTEGEQKAMQVCAQRIIDNANTILNQQGFRLQKGLYANFFIGAY